MGDFQRFIQRLVSVLIWLALQVFYGWLVWASFASIGERDTTGGKLLWFGIGTLLLVAAVYNVRKTWRWCMEVMEGNQDEE